MKLKLTQDGHAVLKDGKPVYVHSDGREEAFDAAGAMTLLVGKHFETSAVAGGLNIPHEIAAAAFGDSFRIERGQLVAYDKGDVPVYSLTRYGEVANFEEGLSHLLERYPNKEMIRRKEVAAPPGQQAQKACITRAQFDAMPQASRAKFFQEGGSVSDGTSVPAPVKAPAQQAGDKKVMTRAQFDVTPPSQAAAFFKAGGKVVD